MDSLHHTSTNRRNTDTPQCIVDYIVVLLLLLYLTNRSS